jgi:hypothetical protein
MEIGLEISVKWRDKGDYSDNEKKDGDTISKWSRFKKK